MGRRYGESRSLFPEMENYLGKCKYTDCVHLSEPGCAVTEAVNTGEISDVRYLSYVSLRNEENIENSPSIP